MAKEKFLSVEPEDGMELKIYATSKLGVTDVVVEIDSYCIYYARVNSYSADLMLFMRCYGQLINIADNRIFRLKMEEEQRLKDRVERFVEKD